MTTARICEIEPFRYQSAPVTGDPGVSGSQINEQAIEDYLNRLRTALCADIQALVDAGGQTGVTRFLQLTDVPNSYAGSSGYYVTVNGSETALVFTPLPTPEPDRPDLSTRLVSLIKPASGTTLTAASISTVGHNSIVWGGASASHPAVADTNTLTRVYRYRINSNALAGSPASLRHNVATVLGNGGWRFVARWGTPTALAQQRFFTGLTATTGALANANPSTFTDLVGVSYDSAETTLRFIHNDNAGVATRIDLGASFPVDNSSFYEFEMWTEPASGIVNYRVLNVGTGAEATGSVNTNLPAGSTLLTDYIWVNNGTTASAASVDIQCLYLEMPQ